MADRATKTPAIPAVPASADTATRNWMQAVTNILQVMSGQAGTDGDVVVRQRDLSALKTDYNLENLTSEPSGEIPPPPTNLRYSQGLARNFLTWDDPVKTDNVTSIEVWHSTTQNRSNAVKIGIVPIGVESYEHGYVDVHTQSYYWIRSVSFGGKYSAWEPPDSQGGLVVPALITQTIAEMLDTLYGNISENQLVQSLNTRLNNIESNTQGIVQVNSYVADLYGEYTVKVDAGGRVAGIGLASSSAGSQIVFLSDKVLFVKPDGSGTPKPLMVVTTVNGVAAVGISGDLIADGLVMARMISAGAITADKIAANTITAAQIATSAITADELATNAVTATKISAGAITADKIAATNVITNTLQIGADLITVPKYADGGTELITATSYDYPINDFAYTEGQIAVQVTVPAPPAGVTQQNLIIVAGRTGLPSGADSGYKMTGLFTGSTLLKMSGWSPTAEGNEIMTFLHSTTVANTYVVREKKSTSSTKKVISSMSITVLGAKR